MNRRSLAAFVPLLDTLRNYRLPHFSGDLIAGMIVAVMLVPQSMAYALLAGLPPQTGLYASIVPLVLYGLWGSSNSLAVGPVAMISLLVVSGVGALVPVGSEAFIQHCLTLALLVGLMQIAMSLFRLGFLVNFISHPVLMGFTSAAALVIGLSQAKHLLGVSVPGSESTAQLLVALASRIPETNGMTLLLGAVSISGLLAFSLFGERVLRFGGCPKSVAGVIAKLGPLVMVVATAGWVHWGGLDERFSVKVVGEIPAGLPRLTFPDLQGSTLVALLPLALVITLVGYLESISVAKSLAARRREKVDANRELFALGMADLGAAFSGGYPVTGGFSRSLVNFSAGVRTPVGSLVTALLVLLSVLFLTPLFYPIPNVVLAAIIVVAVAKLIDPQAPWKLWRYSRPDAVAYVLTFLAVLILGIEQGILIGIAGTLVLLMWKMSRPHVAEVGRLGASEQFRNVLRHPVNRAERILAFRIDESLNFANAPVLESFIQERLSDRPEIESVLLISSGVNDIDATALESLENLIESLAANGVAFYLSDVKGPVLDRLQRAGFDANFLKNHVFLSAHQAMQVLGGPCLIAEPGRACPDNEIDQNDPERRAEPPKSGLPIDNVRKVEGSLPD